MRENVTISYRGARYEIGRGQHFYGIWVAGAPQQQPLEWWPETPVGWSHAWARFTGIEVPGTIVAVGPPAPPPPPPAPSAPAVPDAATAASPASQATPPGPTGDAPAATTDAPAATTDAPAATTDAPAATVDAPPPTTDAPAATADTSPATTEAPPATDDSEPGTPGQPGESTVLVGQPVTQVGHPAALAVQPAGPPTPRAARPGLAGPLAAGLIIIGVICGVAGLFPGYLGESLIHEPADLVPHAIYFAVWLGAAALIVAGGSMRRLGALVAVGTSVVTFGLYFADAGTALADGASVMGAGLTLGLIGWALCAAGSGLALRLKQPGQPALGRPRGFGVLHVLTVVAALGSLGTAIAFAPAWDTYLLRFGNGATTSTTLGDAFSNPGWVITGDVFVMILVVVAIVVAGTWRPVREGAWLMAGAIIPMAAQAISALIQVGENTSPTLFGISGPVARASGLTISNGVTAAFWLYCAFVIVVMLTCGWLLLSPRSAVLDIPPPPVSPYPPGTPHHAFPGASYPGASYPGASYPGASYPGAIQGTAPGHLPGGFQQMAEPQQLGDGQRL